MGKFREYKEDRLESNIEEHDLINLKDIVSSITEMPDEEMTKMINDLNKIKDIPDQKFRIPHGVKNYARLGNVHIGDLFHHIQKGLNKKDLCLLQLITGELHKCIYFNPDDKYYECAENRNCEECLSRWMNSDKW